MIGRSTIRGKLFILFEKLGKHDFLYDKEDQFKPITKELLDAGQKIQNPLQN